MKELLHLKLLCMKRKKNRTNVRLFWGKESRIKATFVEQKNKPKIVTANKRPRTMLITLSNQ